MKRKTLITALIAIGFTLSGVSHALSVLKPDGTRSVANVEGNKLMLRDATGKLWLPARDGTYKTDDGRTLYVKGGIIGAQSGNAGAPTGNNGTGNIVGPMFTPPAVQGGNAAAPIGNKINAGANAPKFSPPKIPERITGGLPGAPGIVAHPTAGCPDPAITGLRALHASRNTDGTYNFLLAATITNKGSVPFISRRGQQAITFSEGRRMLLFELWSGTQRLAAGASENQYLDRVVRWNPWAKSRHGFTAQITYDPDIFIDGNPQNDDCNMSNNKLSLSADEAVRQIGAVR